ncbi:hypothetical protein [Myroides odoratimimus]|uniref:hypothetical protein n=1 Tax=Myroides odoratimimus TaxID=76832 RepID=UPI0004687DB4|nr:hypothetical protein [Myroides odoratimimus]
MKYIEIQRDGVNRKVTIAAWQNMKKEKATYGWSEVHSLPEEVAVKEAEILESKAKADEEKEKTDESTVDETKKEIQNTEAVKEVKVKKSKAKADEE